MLVFPWITYIPVPGLQKQNKEKKPGDYQCVYVWELSMKQCFGMNNNKPLKHRLLWSQNLELNSFPFRFIFLMSIKERVDLEIKLSGYKISMLMQMAKP